MLKAIFLFGLAIVPIMAFAQPQVPTAAPENDRSQPGTTITAQPEPKFSQVIDRYLATRMALGDEEERAIAYVAMNGALREDVKVFARSTIDEDRKALSDLQDFCLATDAKEPASALGRHILEIQEEVARQRLANAKRDLENMPSSQFDRAYLRQQRNSKIETIALLTAFERHASPQLKRVIAIQSDVAKQALKSLQELLDEG